MQYIFFPKHEKTSVKLKWLADYIAIVDDYDFQKPFCIAGQLHKLLTGSLIADYDSYYYLAKVLDIYYQDAEGLYWDKSSRTQKGAVESLRKLAKNYE